MMRRGRTGASGDAQLRADEYRLLRDLVSERLGMWFGPEARSSLERRLRERLVVLGLSSFAEYYQLLKYSPARGGGVGRGVELLTTHETYLFREDYQLRAFENEVLPGSPIAEGATTALGVERGLLDGRRGVLDRDADPGVGALRPSDGWEVRVYGSDISRRCVAAARRGVYGPASFRTTPTRRRRRGSSASNGALAAPDDAGASDRERERSAISGT